MAYYWQVNTLDRYLGLLFRVDEPAPVILWMNGK